MPSCKQICPHEEEEEEEEEEQKLKKKTISEHFANFHDAPGGPADETLNFNYFFTFFYISVFLPIAGAFGPSTMFGESY